MPYVYWEIDDYPLKIDRYQFYTCNAVMLKIINSKTQDAEVLEGRQIAAYFNFTPALGSSRHNQSYNWMRIMSRKSWPERRTALHGVRLSAHGKIWGEPRRSYPVSGTNNEVSFFPVSDETRLPKCWLWGPADSLNRSCEQCTRRRKEREILV